MCCECDNRHRKVQAQWEAVRLQNGAAEKFYNDPF
jgi:hypothetical protein